MGKRAYQNDKNYKCGLRQKAHEGASKSMKKRMQELRDRRVFCNEDQQQPAGVADDIADDNNGGAPAVIQPADLDDVTECDAISHT